MCSVTPLTLLNSVLASISEPEIIVQNFVGAISCSKLQERGGKNKRRDEHSLSPKPCLVYGGSETDCKDNGNQLFFFNIVN